MLKIGGVLTGLFIAAIGCSQIYHIENPPESIEYKPLNSCRIFNFENDLKDSEGYDFFTGSSNVTYSGTLKKFDSYGLVSTDNVLSSYIENDDFFEVGESFSISAWVRPDSSEPVYNQHYIFNFESISETNRIRISIRSDNELYVLVRKNDTNVALIYSEIYFTDDVFNLLSVTYDSVSDKIILTLNNEKYESSVLGGSWDLSDGLFIFRSYLSGSQAMEIRANIAIDEMLISKNIIDDVKFIEHHINNTKYITYFTKQDVILRPDVGGKIKFDTDSNDVVLGPLTLIRQDDRHTSDGPLYQTTLTDTYTLVDCTGFIPDNADAVIFEVIFHQIAGTPPNAYDAEFKPVGVDGVGTSFPSLLKQDKIIFSYSTNEYYQREITLLLGPIKQFEMRAAYYWHHEVTIIIKGYR